MTSNCAKFTSHTCAEDGKTILDSASTFRATSRSWNCEPALFSSLDSSGTRDRGINTANCLSFLSRCKTSWTTLLAVGVPMRNAPAFVCLLGESPRGYLVLWRSPSLYYPCCGNGVLVTIVPNVLIVLDFNHPSDSCVLLYISASVDCIADSSYAIVSSNPLNTGIPLRDHCICLRLALECLD